MIGGKRSVGQRYCNLHESLNHHKFGPQHHPIAGRVELKTPETTGN